jgi:hypothetical protein
VFERKGHAYVSGDAQNPTGVVDHIAEVDKDLPAALIASGPFDFNRRLLHRLLARALNVALKILYTLRRTRWLQARFALPTISTLST